MEALLAEIIVEKLADAARVGAKRNAAAAASEAEGLSQTACGTDHLLYKLPVDHVAFLGILRWQTQHGVAQTLTLW